MLKNVSAGERTIEEKSVCIKERNKEIKKGNYSIIDGGLCSFSDLIIVGEQHKEASIYLRDCVESAINTEELIEFEVETEEIYNVQVWSGLDFDLSAIIQK